MTTFEEQHPGLKGRETVDYEFLNGLYGWLEKWFDNHVLSTNVDGIPGVVTLRDYYSFHDEFEYINRPRKLTVYGVKTTPMYNQEDIMKTQIDKTKVKEAFQAIIEGHKDFIKQGLERENIHNRTVKSFLEALEENNIFVEHVQTVERILLEEEK